MNTNQKKRGGARSNANLASICSLDHSQAAAKMDENTESFAMG